MTAQLIEEFTEWVCAYCFHLCVTYVCVCVWGVALPCITFAFQTTRTARMLWQLTRHYKSDTHLSFEHAINSCCLGLRGIRLHKGDTFECSGFKRDNPQRIKRVLRDRVPLSLCVVFPTSSKQTDCKQRFLHSFIISFKHLLKMFQFHFFLYVILFSAEGSIEFQMKS